MYTTTAISSVGFLLNLLEILLLLRSKKYKQPFLLNVLSLGFADLLIYFICLVYHILRFIEVYNKTISLAYVYCVCVSTLASQFHLVSIAVQRLIAVKYPLQCPRYLTQRRCVMVVAFIWLLSLGLPGGLLRYNTQLTYISCIICALILVLSYAYITFRVIRRKTIAATRNNSGRNVVWFSLAITLAFMVCTFPFVVKSAAMKKGSAEYYAVVCLFWLNPLLDPILYFLFNALKSGKGCCGRNKQQLKSVASTHVSGSVRLAVINKGVTQD